MSIYCHFFHFFIDLSVYCNFCIHSLVFLPFLIDSQGLLLSVLSQFCLILSVFTPNERASPNGCLAVSQREAFWVLDTVSLQGTPYGFLTVSQSEAFWVFDIVSLRVRRFGFLTSFNQMRSFYVFEVFCSVYTITCILDPYEHFIPFWVLRSFAVLDYYVYNWSLRVFYTLLRFWGRLRVLELYEYLIPFWVVDVFCGV